MPLLYRYSHHLPLLQGFSTSETFYAVLDMSTNYCNLRNLLAGSGLDRTAGFSETTSDSICTQYSSADCEVYWGPGTTGAGDEHWTGMSPVMLMCYARWLERKCNSWWINHGAISAQWLKLIHEMRRDNWHTNAKIIIISFCAPFMSDAYVWAVRGAMHMPFSVIYDVK